MMIKNLFIFILFIIIFIFYLCELDRNFMIQYDFYSYYYNNFPKQILNGIHNSVYRLYEFRPQFDLNKFKFHKYLLNNKDKLLNEFNNVNKNKFEYAHNTSKLLNENNSYKYLRIKFYNKIFENNLDHFDTLKTLLKKYNNIQTCFFSIMEKKINIPYHKGPYNGILRYHFPLIVQNTKNCYLEVLGKKFNYEKPFLFDDTFPHQLIKNDNSYKVVLIIDIDNPYSLFFNHHKYI